jgi:hypothetical protein
VSRCATGILPVKGTYPCAATMSAPESGVKRKARVSRSLFSPAESSVYSMALTIESMESLSPRGPGGEGR